MDKNSNAIVFIPMRFHIIELTRLVPAPVRSALWNDY